MSIPKKKSISTVSLISFLIAAAGYVAVLSEFYYGSTFTISLSAGIITAVFILIAIKQKQIFFPKLTTALFGAYVLWNICITPFSKDLTLSFWEDIRLVSLFLIFLSAYNLSLVKNQGKNIVISFITLGSLILFVDLVIYILSDAFSQQVFFSGFFSWHNQMAGFLLLSIPLAASLGLTKNRLQRISFFTMFFVSFFAMAMTRSRGGWMILALQSVLLIFFLRNIIKKYLLLLAVIILVLLSLTFFTQPSLIKRLTSIPMEFTSSKSVSGEGRTAIWTTSLDMLSDYPLLGVGPGAFGSVFASHQEVPWFYARSAHNHLIQVGIESGVIGLTLFVLLILSIVRELIPAKISSRPLLFYAIIASLTGSFIHSLIDYDFSTISLYLFFWLFLGTALSLTKNPNHTLIIKGKLRLIYPVLGVFLVLIVFVEISEDTYLQAKYYLTTGDIKTAKESLDRSLKFNPYNGKSYLLSSELYYNQKNYELSEFYAKKSIQFLPYESSHYTILGAISADKGNYANAAKWYEKAVSIKPFADPNAYTGLAYSYQMMGEQVRAEKILTKAVNDIFPLNQTYREFQHVYYVNGLTNNLASLYIELGKIKLASGEKIKAEKLFRTVREDLAPPDQPETLPKEILN